MTVLARTGRHGLPGDARRRARSEQSAGRPL